MLPCLMKMSLSDAVDVLFFVSIKSSSDAMSECSSLPSNVKILVLFFHNLCFIFYLVIYCSM